jgi:hypothetical protein
VHLHNARAGMFRFEMLPTVLREFKKMCFFNVKKHSQIWFFFNIAKSNASISNLCLKVSGVQLWFCVREVSSLSTHRYTHSIFPKKAHFDILNAVIANVYSLIMTQLGAYERHQRGGYFCPQCPLLSLQK